MAKADTKAKEAVVSEEVVVKDTVTVVTAGLNKNEIKIVDPKIKTTDGKDVDIKDYFYAPEGQTPIAPPFFKDTCGKVVDRDDLVEVFEKIFSPEDGFIFLKDQYKEVYGVLVPLRYTKIGTEEDALLGDFKYHAVSFVLDGSVNVEKLKSFLKKISTSYEYKKN